MVLADIETFLRIIILALKIAILVMYIIKTKMHKKTHRSSGKDKWWELTISQIKFYFHRKSPHFCGLLQRGFKPLFFYTTKKIACQYFFLCIIQISSCGNDAVTCKLLIKKGVRKYGFEYKAISWDYLFNSWNYLFNFEYSCFG